MTDARRSPGPSGDSPRRAKASRRPSTRTTTAWIAALSSAAFLALWGGLSFQMAAGKDPALGPKAEQAVVAARQAAPRRRVVRSTVIVRKVVRGGAGSPSAAAPARPAAPAPAPAAAPAPAPAPVVTRTS